MNRRTLAIWQLSMLTAIHFTVDMLSGMLPGFLPRLLEKYTLSIGTGTLLLTLCAFSSNGVQREHSAKPRPDRCWFRSGWCSAARSAWSDWCRPDRERCGS